MEGHEERSLACMSDWPRGPGSQHHRLQHLGGGREPDTGVSEGKKGCHEEIAVQLLPGGFSQYVVFMRQTALISGFSLWSGFTLGSSSVRTGLIHKMSDLTVTFFFFSFFFFELQTQQAFPLSLVLHNLLSRFHLFSQEKTVMSPIKPLIISLGCTTYLYKLLFLEK